MMSSQSARSPSHSDMPTTSGRVSIFRFEDNQAKEVGKVEVMGEKFLVEGPKDLWHERGLDVEADRPSLHDASRPMRWLGGQTGVSADVSVIIRSLVLTKLVRPHADTVLADRSISTREELSCLRWLATAERAGSYPTPFLNPNGRVLSQP